MARIIGNRPDVRTAAEDRIYSFVMRELPDYIFALFNATFITIPDSNVPEGHIIKYVQTDKSGNPDYNAIGIQMEEFNKAAVSGNVFSCDAILLIPHMGCFILEIYSAGSIRREKGVTTATYRNGDHHIDMDRRRRREIQK